MLSSDPEGGTRQVSLSGVRLEIFQAWSSFSVHISKSGRKLILLANALTKNLLESVLNREKRLKYLEGLDRLSSVDVGVEQESAQHGAC